MQGQSAVWSTLLLLAGLALAAWRWLQANPRYNPWAPLSIDDPPGWVTGRKLGRLRAQPALCRGFLERSAIAFTRLPPAGEGACRRDDSIRLQADPQRGLALRPDVAPASCAVGAGLALWLRQSVQPAALDGFGQRVTAIEHLGTANCRRIAGRHAWSEHATANAIDVAGFVLADGRRVSVRKDWAGEGARGLFLRRVRNGACGVFGTVLSPDYNAAHADHFHLDQAQRGWSLCR